MSKFVIVDAAQGKFAQKARQFVVEAVSSCINAPVPVLNGDNTDAFADCSAIIFGKNDSPMIQNLVQTCGFQPETRPQGYAIQVCPNPNCPEIDWIVISGADDLGMLYGCVDFAEQDLGNELFTKRNLRMSEDRYFKNLLGEKLPAYRRSTAPSVSERGIWTWGHVIYDYRRFIDNMLRLKLNVLTVWNDYVPVNIKDVVAYAHENGVMVFLGYSWGWNSKMYLTTEGLNYENTLDSLKQQVIDAYEHYYADVGADGIYFQSFTETTDEYLGKMLIAEAVTNFVNETGGELLRRYPGLRLQFGLHATSVRKKLEYMKNIDKRIEIIWEDCGSFPYGYNPVMGDVDEMLSFAEEISVLRGQDDWFGSVFKGMAVLDWPTFSHQSGPFTMGESGPQFVAKRNAFKQRMWKVLQAYWLKNGEAVRKTVDVLSRKKNGQLQIVGLVEDGVFEAQVPFVVAMFAEMLWDCQQPAQEAIFHASLRSCAQFSNT